MRPAVPEQKVIPALLGDYAVSLVLVPLLPLPVLVPICTTGLVDAAGPLGGMFGVGFGFGLAVAIIIRPSIPVFPWFPMTTASPRDALVAVFVGRAYCRMVVAVGPPPPVPNPAIPYDTVLLPTPSRPVPPIC